MSRKKCLFRTSLATSCLFRLMPVGATARMASAISGEAHSASTALCFWAGVLGLPLAYSLPTAINRPAQLEYSRHWGRADSRPYFFARAALRSMKRANTC